MEKPGRRSRMRASRSFPRLAWSVLIGEIISRKGCGTEEVRSTFQGNSQASAEAAAEPARRVSAWFRLKVAVGLLARLRRHDFRAAGTFIRTMFPGKALPARVAGFVGWTL